LVRRLLLCLAVAALSACGGDEPQGPPPLSRSPSPLCPSLLRRLEAANDRIDRLESTIAETEDRTQVPPAVGDKLEKTTREYLKLRVRAAAQGCLST
jgi:hypothetical protein